MQSLGCRPTDARWPRALASYIGNLKSQRRYTASSIAEFRGRLDVWVQTELDGWASGSTLHGQRARIGTDAVARAHVLRPLHALCRDTKALEKFSELFNQLFMTRGHQANLIDKTQRRMDTVTRLLSARTMAMDEIILATRVESAHPVPNYSSTTRLSSTSSPGCPHSALWRHPPTSRQHRRPTEGLSRHGNRLGAGGRYGFAALRGRDVPADGQGGPALRWPACVDGIRRPFRLPGSPNRSRRAADLQLPDSLRNGLDRTAGVMLTMMHISI